MRAGRHNQVMKNVAAPVHYGDCEAQPRRCAEEAGGCMGDEANAAEECLAGSQFLGQEAQRC